MSVNKCFVFIKTFTMGISGMLSAYGICYSNQCTTLFSIKFDWKDGTDNSVHTSLMGSILVLGMTFGAVSAGVLMKKGRRKIIIYSSLLIMLSVCLCIPLNFYLIIVGRFFFGVGTGFLSVVAPKFVHEILPSHL